jgi:hypothetical protein
LEKLQRFAYTDEPAPVTSRTLRTTYSICSSANSGNIGREKSFGEILCYRERTLGVAEVSPGFLQMNWNGIVNATTNPFFLQKSAEFIAFLVSRW